MKLTKNKLRVNHLPQIPCKGFKVDVKNEREAYLLQEAFANQHLFLFENNFIPDYANVILLEMWDDDLEENEDGEKWTDYYNENEIMDWEEFKDEYSDYINGNN